MHEAQMAGIRLKLIYAVAALRSAEPCSMKPVYLGLQELRRGRRVSTPARPPCRLWRGGAPAASAISERLFHRRAYIYVCTLRLPTRTAVEFTFFAAFGIFVRLAVKLLAAAKWRNWLHKHSEMVERLKYEAPFDRVSPSSWSFHPSQIAPTVGELR